MQQFQKYSNEKQVQQIQNDLTKYYFLLIQGTVGISLRRTLYYDFVCLAIIVSFILPMLRK